MKIEKLRLRSAYGYSGIPESIVGKFGKMEGRRIEGTRRGEVQGNAGAGKGKQPG